MGADEEVIRILAPADPDVPDADAWHVVTLTRPDSSAEWKPFAAYGPMPLDAANGFLGALGATAVSVENRADSDSRHSAARAITRPR